MVRLRPLRIFFWSSSVPEIQTESNHQHHHAVKADNWDQHCLPLLPSLQVQPSEQFDAVSWYWHILASYVFLLWCSLISLKHCLRGLCRLCQRVEHLAPSNWRVSSSHMHAMFAAATQALWPGVEKAKEHTSRCFTTRIIVFTKFQHQLMSEQKSEVVPCAWCCQQNCCCSCSNAASFIQVASCQDWFGDWLDTRTAVFASPWFQSVCGKRQQCAVLSRRPLGLLYAVVACFSPLRSSLTYIDLGDPWSVLLRSWNS